MTVVQNSVTLSEKRRPGTGSSPKTAGSQSVKRIKHDRNIKAYKSVLHISIYLHGRRKEAKHKMFLRVTIDIVAAVQ